MSNEADAECFSAELDSRTGSAKTLAPGIENLLQARAVSVQELSAIAIVSGPGSFTGLRVGIATAKAMAYALKIPVVEVDALDAVAYQIAEEHERLHVVMDAYRGQVFCAMYGGLMTGQADEKMGRYMKATPTRIVDIDALLRELLEYNRDDIVLCGPGCDRVKRFVEDPESMLPQLATEIKTRVHWLDGKGSFPKAESVARLALMKYQRGQSSETFGLLPRYYRASAAEEKQRSGE
jgi:tRNA threonylcarbamoyladenosine biosynthesis protein TsaB